MVNYYEETDYVQSYSKTEFKDFWSEEDCNLNGIKYKGKKAEEAVGNWERGHEI